MMKGAQMKYYKCDYADERCKRGKKDGWCKHKQIYFDGNGCFPFDDILVIVENKDICKNSSIFGNYYISLNDEHIEALKSGKAVALLHEEYNIFIKINDSKSEE